ncbi:MAG: hypothetical protein ABI675_03080 [Chitinophagaceae bacterium]
MGKRSKRKKVNKKLDKKASKWALKNKRLRTYKEVIDELTAKGIKPYDPSTTFADFELWEDSPLKKIFEEFFNYGQEYLDRKDLGFDIEPGRIYFSSNITLNALARKVGRYYLVEIYMGAIKWMYDFYMPKEDLFKDATLAPFIKITQIRKVTPAFFMLQLASIYFLYHEVGHLIQRSGEAGDSLEFALHECKGDKIKVSHMRELDADWHSAYCMAMAIKQFAEVEIAGRMVVDRWLLSDIASLGLAAIYMYFINRTDKRPALYYEEKCHPHPTVRLSYMIIFIMENLQGNVGHELDQNTILNNAILISEFLMKEKDKNIVEDYSKQLYENSKSIEKYIHSIMDNTEKYPYLCKHLLKK